MHFLAVLILWLFRIGLSLEIYEELLCLKRKFSLKPRWAEVEFSNDVEGFVINIYW